MTVTTAFILMVLVGNAPSLSALHVHRLLSLRRGRCRPGRDAAADRARQRAVAVHPVGLAIAPPIARRAGVIKRAHCNQRKGIEQ
jgi:hypothetical protein